MKIRSANNRLLFFLRRNQASAPVPTTTRRPVSWKASSRTTVRCVVILIARGAAVTTAGTPRRKAPTAASMTSRGTARIATPRNRLPATSTQVHMYVGRFPVRCTYVRFRLRSCPRLASRLGIGSTQAAWSYCRSWCSFGLRFACAGKGGAVSDGAVLLIARLAPLPEPLYLRHCVFLRVDFFSWVLKQGA